MIVYFGERITITVQGQAWRAEACEHCGQRFHYRAVFAAKGSATNPYLLDPNGAPRRAEAEARDELDHALRHQVFPVPCPHCNLYQPAMLPALRAEQYPRMHTAARLLLWLAGALALVGCVLSGAAVGDFDRAFLGPVAVVRVGLPALAVAAAAWVWRARRRRQAAYDPNAEAHAPDRRRVAAAFALTPEGFARLRIPATPAPGVRLGSLRGGQLVGQNCVRCGGRIPHELDSRFCRGCGLPVHDRCAVPTEGGWCPVCGAAAPQA